MIEILPEVNLERLERELKRGTAPVLEAREEALKETEEFEGFCENCCFWELCDERAILWMYTSGYGKCRSSKFCDEYLWQNPEPPEDGLVILEASCQAAGFVTGPKFGCRHCEGREDG